MSLQNLPFLRIRSSLLVHPALSPAIHGEKETAPTETKPDEQQTVTRLALCVVVAMVLYAAARKVSPLEPHRPWLKEHKAQAIAITAAILLGPSLLLFPPEEGGAESAAPEEGPCVGYERTEDLP